MRISLRRVGICFSLILLASSRLLGDSVPPYLNTALPIGARVEDLVSRMTWAEKISQLRSTSAAVPRLTGMKNYTWWNECLHGVAGDEGFATQFPQAIGMAATWDPDLLRKVADAISDEARAKHHQAKRSGRTDYFIGVNFFSPNINIFRDPRWGRGQESYGEDPYLTSRMVVNYVRGLQGDDPAILKTIATPKHFAVHSGPESLRTKMNVDVAEKDLRETYLPAFEAAVREAGAGSVMCAYNRVNGAPACANPRLIDHVLRQEWGFNGVVVSDCGAIELMKTDHHWVPTVEEASERSLQVGTDLDCGKAYGTLAQVLKERTWPEARLQALEASIDRSIRTVLTARFRVGLFDPDERVSYSKIPMSVVDSSAHRELARTVAEKSFVLLKNEGVLPLPPRGIRKIAVLGPNADELKALLGNYHGAANRWVTPLEGIRRYFSRLPEAERPLIRFAKGSEVSGPHFEPIGPEHLGRLGGDGPRAFRARYFNNEQVQGTHVAERIDERIDRRWNEAGAGITGVSSKFSIRWTAILVPPVTGEYLFGATTDVGFRLYLDDKLVEDGWVEHSGLRVSRKVTLEAGSLHILKFEYAKSNQHGIAKLEWAIPGAHQTVAAERARAEAVALARDSDVALLFLGITPEVEGEMVDRPRIELPEIQEKLLEEVAATGTRVVLTLMNGGPVSAPWAAEHVPAILEAWYPGVEGGTAIARTLFGDVSPSGKLPLTIYRRTEDLPDYLSYSMKGRTYRYFEGSPLYSFGHGLSYTSFVYSDLEILTPVLSSSSPELQIQVTLANSGARSGDEIAQLYVTVPGLGVPLRALKAFKRVNLQAGQASRLRFAVPLRELESVGADGISRLLPGEYRLTIGGGQPGTSAQTLAGKFLVTTP